LQLSPNCKRARLLSLPTLFSSVGANSFALSYQSSWSGSLAPMFKRAKRVCALQVRSFWSIRNAAQAIAVILHELATNAAKYGALSVAEGHAEVTWSYRPDGRLVLRWEEQGSPTTTPPTHRLRHTDNMADDQRPTEWRNAPGLAR